MGLELLKEEKEMEEKEMEVKNEKYEKNENEEDEGDWNGCSDDDVLVECDDVKDQSWEVMRPLDWMEPSKYHQRNVETALSISLFVSYDHDDLMIDVNVFCLSACF